MHSQTIALTVSFPAGSSEPSRWNWTDLVDAGGENTVRIDAEFPVIDTPDLEDESDMNFALTRNDRRVSRFDVGALIESGLSDENIAVDGDLLAESISGVTEVINSVLADLVRHAREEA